LRVSFVGRLLYQNVWGQSILGNVHMTAASLPQSIARPRGFQFRLATLLIAMAWAALVSLALRTPTALWSSTIAVTTLITVLMAILVIIYRTGRTRAMAVGFLVFCVGYLTYLAILTGTLRQGLTEDWTPAGAAFEKLFTLVHGQQQTLPAAFGGMGGGYMSGEGSMDSGMGGMGGGMGGMPIGPRYDEASFISIANHALACVLGIVGAMAAQTLHATRRTNVD
jgi:hypothetical protein